MADDLWSEEDASFERRERFRARRETIELMKRMGVEPKPVTFETPKGAINSEILRNAFDKSNGSKA